MNRIASVTSFGSFKIALRCILPVIPNSLLLRFRYFRHPIIMCPTVCHPTPRSHPGSSTSGTFLIYHPAVSSLRPGLERMSKSRQDFVKGVVCKAEAVTEMERDSVVSGAELGLWDAEMRPTAEARPPSAGSWTPTACTREKKSRGRNPHLRLTCCLKEDVPGRRARWLSVARRCFLPYIIFFFQHLKSQVLCTDQSPHLS
jgi:hypothetical protein